MATAKKLQISETDGRRNKELTRKKVDKHLKKECRELTADIPTSAELLMIPRLSRNHRTHAPVTAIAPCSHRNV